MDLFEATSSMRNSVGQDCDKEKNKSNKNTRCPQGGGDNCNVVFTPISNSTEYNIAQNGPRPRNINSVSSSESRQFSKQSDINSDSRNSEATSSQACGTVSSSSAEPDSSQSHRDSSCDNGIDTHEVQCQRRQVTDNINVNNQPSTSGTNKSSEADSSSCRENRKRPSTLKLNRSDYVESSSDTGDDDYSLGSEDGCIYTYRGGEHLADLPSSFFSLDMGLPLDKHLPMLPNYPVPPQPLPARGDSRASSPDMDFIEMDFDPGPSCEVDTGDESTPDADVEAAGIMPEDDEPPLVIRGTSPEYLAAARPSNPIPAPSCRVDQEVPSTSRAITVISSCAEEPEKDNVFYGPYITHVNARGEEILVRRTMTIGVYREPLSLHISSGDLVSPKEMSIYDEDQTEKEQPFGHQINQGPQFDSANLSSALYHITMAKKLIGLVEQAKSSDHLDSTDMTSQATPAVASTSASCGTTGDAGASACVEPPRCMVWSEREACERQVTQIGTSACGATAVVNVFIALGVPINTERINSAVGTRQRANNAPLPRYLLTRAVAGCTAADLVSGIQRASEGLVTARFFPTYPERAVSLSHWLADWISLGAVPILTLNLQVGCEGEIPDAWHHQMVFGVSSRGVYLCNPVECVRETVLWQRLTSPSVLLVRARDVLARFSANTDLTPLMVVPDRRFHTFNVLGQVVNVIREWRATGWSEHGTRTRHIRLPAAYQAGVTIAALTGSEAHRRLMHAPQLPILAAETEADKSR